MYIDKPGSFVLVNADFGGLFQILACSNPTLVNLCLIPADSDQTAAS